MTEEILYDKPPTSEEERAAYLAWSEYSFPTPHSPRIEFINGFLAGAAWQKEDDSIQRAWLST